MSNQHDDRVCRRVIYSGRVQGVGFRYSTASIARRFPVAGYVRNRPDGTVELVAEGNANILREFLDEIARVFAANITDSQVEDWRSNETFQDFEIRY